MAEPVAVFISYAPEDDSMREELEKHLSGLGRAGVIRIWSPGRIAAGEHTREVVKAKLAAAEVVLLLMSASYIASDYLYEVEAKGALGRKGAGKARVLMVLLHPCDWAGDAFEGLSPLPANGKPVSSWSNRNEAWIDVVRGVRAAIRSVAAPAVATVPAYESSEIRAVAEDLERARLRRRALVEAKASTEAIDLEIIQMRRTLREGGQLRAGDALGEGRYLLLDRLGKGGFGSVWRALDRTAGEQVAIKVLHPSEAQERSRRERFFRGARVMATLKHEAVVRVLEEHGEDGGYLYFVMELVAGLDLHRAIIEKWLLPEELVPILLRVADALGEAHARGIIHRDVKPSNVVLDASGQPKLTDFDLVAARDTTGGTKTGALGTYLFTAPEQLNNAKEADARADVYGLGMTALFCLYGAELPAIVTRRPERVIAALSCSDAVKTVLTRAIELEPAERFADAKAFGAALRIAAAMPTLPKHAPVHVGAEEARHLTEHSMPKRSQRLPKPAAAKIVPPSPHPSKLGSASPTAGGWPGWLPATALGIVAAFAVGALGFLMWARFVTPGTTTVPTGSAAVGPAASSSADLSSSPSARPPVAKTRILPSPNRQAPCEKRCNGVCVSLDDPRYGCRAANCEPTNLSNDPQNCGMCGIGCSPLVDGAPPTCQNGRCDAQCYPGFHADTRRRCIADGPPSQSVAPAAPKP